MLRVLLALFRKLRTNALVAGKGRYLTYGTDLHVGRGTRLWAPHKLTIGHHVYIGKDVHIEANCEIGDFCLIANRVSIVGRRDHDPRVLGVPMRFTRWIGAVSPKDMRVAAATVVGEESWIGYGAIILSGVSIGKGCVVAAGSVVTQDLPPYAVVAGNPAVVIGSRFRTQEEIAVHERKIRGGRFESSERGYEYWTVKPGP